MKNIHWILKPTLIALGFMATLSHAELAVVVNKDSKLDKADAQSVTGLFLGKQRHINNIKVVPVDQEVGADARDEFYGKFINKTESALNAHWAKLLFTGKVSAPRRVMDDVEVIEYLGENPDRIGYIHPTSVDETVKVVFMIP